MIQNTKAYCRWLATLTLSLLGFGAVNAAPPLPSVDATVFAQQPVRLDNGVTGEIVRFQSHNPTEWSDLLGKQFGSSVNLTGQIFNPKVARKRLPAIIVVPGSGGLAPHHLQQANALTKAGFAVLLIDPFGGRGISGTISDQGRLSWPASTYDVGAAFRYLLTRRDVDHDAIGAIGSSRGGTAVMMAAMEPVSRALLGPMHRLRAVVAGYPWCGVQFRDARLTSVSALLALSGDHDDWVSLQQCQGAIQALANRGENARLMIFPNALHAFDRTGVPPTKIPGAPTATTYPTVFMNDAGQYFDLRRDVVDANLKSTDFTRAAVEGGFVHTGVTVGTQGDQSEQFIDEMTRFLLKHLASDHQPVAQ